jgi:hypothetical protein
MRILDKVVKFDSQEEINEMQHKVRYEFDYKKLDVKVMAHSYEQDEGIHVYTLRRQSDEKPIIGYIITIGELIKVGELYNVLSEGLMMVELRDALAI